MKERIQNNKKDKYFDINEKLAIEYLKEFDYSSNVAENSTLSKKHKKRLNDF